MTDPFASRPTRHRLEASLWSDEDDGIFGLSYYPDNVSTVAELDTSCGEWIVPDGIRSITLGISGYAGRWHFVERIPVEPGSCFRMVGATFRYDEIPMYAIGYGFNRGGAPHSDADGIGFGGGGSAAVALYADVDADDGAIVAIGGGGAGDYYHASDGHIDHPIPAGSTGPLDPSDGDPAAGTFGGGGAGSPGGAAGQEGRSFIGLGGGAGDLSPTYHELVPDPDLFTSTGGIVIAYYVDVDPGWQIGSLGMG